MMAEIFGDIDRDVVSSLRYSSAVSNRPSFVASAAESRPNLVTDRGTPVSLEDQFVVFHLSRSTDGPAILEASQSVAFLDGSTGEPDVLVSLELLSFHLGIGEEVDADSRATMRISLGKDESSTANQFDTLFWSIAAGLNLYNQANGKPSQGNEFKSDLRKAFGNKPIEVPGGLGKLSFEVVKHVEPPWWKRMFQLAESGTGQGLMSIFGFPAITTQAMKLIDELLDKLGACQPQPIFRSLPMRLALSKYAHDEFTGGSARIRLGVLRPGYCVLARARDYTTILDADPYYYPSYGLLVPGGVAESDLLSGRFDNTLGNVTYVVFRVGMKGTKLDPSFDFR